MGFWVRCHKPVIDRVGGSMKIWWQCVCLCVCVCVLLECVAASIVYSPLLYGRLWLPSSFAPSFALCEDLPEMSFRMPAFSCWLRLKVMDQFKSFFFPLFETKSYCVAPIFTVIPVPQLLECCNDRHELPPPLAAKSLFLTTGPSTHTSKA